MHNDVLRRTHWDFSASLAVWFSCVGGISRDLGDAHGLIRLDTPSGLYMITNPTEPGDPPRIRETGVSVWMVYGSMVWDGLSDEAVLEKYPALN